MPAMASAVAVTATGVVAPAPAILRGLSIRDTSGATNTVKIFDNNAEASGTILHPVQLAANGATVVSIPDGLRAVNGLFLSATGTVEGSVWVG